jgi:hypothetical protein
MDRGLRSRDGVLACCHGFAVVAGSRIIGHVETPVFSGTSVAPAALLVREAGAAWETFRVISVSAVTEVDDDAQRVVLTDSSYDPPPD